MLTCVIIAATTFAVLTFSVIFFPTVKIGRLKTGVYWLVALCGATLLTAFGCAPIKEIINGLTADTAVNPLKILALFFSMTFLSVFLDETGFFGYLAQKAAALAKGSRFSLFVAIYALTSVLTVFTSNDVVILTLTPFICYFCKNTKIDPLPYLAGEFAAANTWSMALIIGNPTNIYLGVSAGIGFLEYLKIMILPTVAAGITEFAIVILIFRKSLAAPLVPAVTEVKPESRADIIIGLVHLIACLAFLVVSGYVNIEMWLVSVVCAASLFICVAVRRLFKRDGKKYLSGSLKRLPWQLIPFVVSMFVIVIYFNYCGVSEKLAAFLGEKKVLWTYGGASFIAANVINNIPMSILFSALPAGLAQSAYYRAVYATIIGSNIGAFLTPIGALAGIMFTDLTERQGVKYGFKRFLLYGVCISVPTLLAALGVLALVI
ncbi:MAG: hypothetical protein IJU83_03320 [Clostridia bacterium]|nr:hypothetical protein [Clostridia bacterium]